jgi:hypothetical protein
MHAYLINRPSMHVSPYALFGNHKSTTPSPQSHSQIEKNSFSHPPPRQSSLVQNDEQEECSSRLWMARRSTQNIHKMVSPITFWTIVLTGARINTQLEKGGKPGIKDLKTDLCDGVRLLYLLVFPSSGEWLMGQEIMSDVDLGKWNRKPYHRFHFVENCVWALNYIRDNGVALTNIGAEGLNSGILLLMVDIVDGNLKLILGLVWTLILRFTIQDIRFVLRKEEVDG